MFQLHHITGHFCTSLFRTGIFSSESFHLASLSLSPGVFTRCVAAALLPLQACGLKILPYRLICAPTEDQMAWDRAVLLNHVDHLGLRVNFEKSNLVPSQSTTFTGVALNSIFMTACTSAQQVDSILAMLPDFQELLRTCINNLILIRLQLLLLLLCISLSV